MKPVKSVLLAAIATLALSACASTGRLSDSERLELYRSHAGDPVDSFHFFGRIDGWSPLGDGALTVRTKPNEAWLLELDGPCPDLGFAQVIGLTSQMNRVHARFDKVLVRGPAATGMPCYIRTIRPLDLKALKQSEKELREARIEEREQQEQG